MKPGVAFPDFIKTEKPMRRRGSDFSDTLSTGGRMRGFLLFGIFCICITILAARLISLQIFKGSYYRKLSDSNRIRTVTVHAPRGIIFDRNGIPLVFNVPGFRKVTTDSKVILLTREEALRQIAKGEKGIEIDSLRQYPYKDASAHVVGYIGQITKEDFGKKKYELYRPGDLIGKEGIEKTYEEKLVGIDGKQLLEVDALGQTIRTLGQTDPIPGQNIRLTLDAKLQIAALEALVDRGEMGKGAVIAMTPKGEVLALVSSPSFDPNLFTMGEGYTTSSSSAYRTLSEVLMDGDGQPLLNRAVSGAYPPGSTFKLVTAAAGLEGKIIDESYRVQDTGVLTVGAFSFANWYYTQYGKTEGSVGVVQGLKRSNDIFFYKLAGEVGVDRLSAMAHKFGVGQLSGIDVDGEVRGILPTTSWKKQVIGESWYLGDTYHYGIGQGYVLTTPLQVNVWTQIIANRGLLYKPHLLKNQKSRPKDDQPLAENIITEKTQNLIRQGMVESCSPGGVAWPLFEFKVKNGKLKIDNKNFFAVPQATTSASFDDYRHVSIACKTGTAQHGGEETLPHAWITLFAPAGNPQIILTVLVESSGEGSNIAAPVAKKILEEWFSR